MNIKDIYNWIMSAFSAEDAYLLVDPAFADTVNGILRWVIPAVLIFVVGRCAYSLLKGRNQELWGYLKYPNDTYVPLRHWENLLGRSRSADVRLNFPEVSRQHAVLTRRQKGVWYIFDTESKGGVLVNGKLINKQKQVKFGDKITVGGVELTLVAPTATEVMDDCQAPQEAAVMVSPLITQIFLSLFSLLCLLALLVNARVNPYLLLTVFGGIHAVMWGYYGLMRMIRRSGFEIESLAFLLVNLGFCTAASAAPYSLLKQFAAFTIGVLLFLFIGWCLRDLKRSQVMRWVMSAIGIGLLVLTFLFADTINGARNWLFVGGMSVQPSELSKICFVYAGAATLDRLLTKRNLLLYILFSGACVGLLALMNDFGTALIFFITFLAVAFLRSGQLSAIFLGSASAGLGALMVLKFRPLCNVV